MSGVDPEEALRREREQQLSAHLAGLFPGLDREGLSEFRAGVEWRSLRGGEVLFQEGDPADAAFLVISGRLRAVTGSGPEERLLNEMAAGETVGEMALLSDGVRSATVYAARDTQLARLSREVFDALTARHPGAMRRIAVFVVERLRRLGSSTPSSSTLAVVPARPGLDVEALVGALEAALAAEAGVRRIDRRAVGEALGDPGAADARDEDRAGLRLVAWLNELDAAGDLTLLVADADWTPWTERALRQADHVLLVVSAADGPGLGATEARLFEQWREVRPPRRSLVLLHPPGGRPQGSAAWLARRDVERHYHVRAGDAHDVSRLGRLLTGRGVGLVLGGGGARGFAHLGVLRALEEAGIPVDTVGGTSIGSIIGALPAMGLSAAEAIGLCRRSFQSLFDPTLPVVSLITGRRIGRRIEEVCAGLDIEDLTTPYFCVATNLSRAGEVVHRRGPLFRAVRSSISLPGVLPPVSIDGDLHVDGGLIDNLPVEPMRALCAGPLIAVDVSPEEDLRSEMDFAAGASGWRLLAQRLNPFGRTRLDLPTISSVLMRSIVVSSLVRQRQGAAEAASLVLKMPVDRFGLLAFDELERIAALGYESSAAALARWWEETRRAGAER